MHLSVPAYNGYTAFSYSSGNYKDTFQYYRASEIIRMNIQETADGSDKVEILLDGS